MLSFLWALVLTVAIEEAVALLFVRSRSVIMPCLACNLLTNPLLNYIFVLSALFIPGAELYVVVFLEIAAFVAEAFVYRLWLGKTYSFCFLLSAAANLCSVAVSGLAG